MDNAVALVQAYLRVNGYFTVAEFPVLEATRHGGYREVTDIDILAFRFPAAGRAAGPSKGTIAEVAFEPDPALGAPVDAADMLVGEVKEGEAHLNPAARNPVTLATALARFGCCAPAEASRVVDQLLNHERAVTAHGHQIRMVAFGTAPQVADAHGYRTIPLSHVLGFLHEYLRSYWDVLRHAQLKDPTLGFLAMLEKAQRGVS
jgi:hypothetical protein